MAACLRRFQGQWAFHAANLALRANVWFNYVATKANVADLPSRRAFEEMAAVLRAADSSFNLADDQVDISLPPIGLEWAEMAETILPKASGPLRGGRALTTLVTPSFN